MGISSDTVPRTRDVQCAYNFEDIFQASIQEASLTTSTSPFSLLLGPAEDGVGTRVVNTVCTMSYNQTLFQERYSRSIYTSQDWIYNDGLTKMCQTMTNCRLSRHYAWFTHGLWFEGRLKDQVKKAGLYRTDATYIAMTTALLMPARQYRRQRTRCGQYICGLIKQMTAA